MMERFAKIVKGLSPWTIFARRSMLDVRQGSEYASDPDISNTLNISELNTVCPRHKA